MTPTEFFNMVFGLFNALGILTLLQTALMVMIIAGVALFLIDKLAG